MAETKKEKETPAGPPVEAEWNPTMPLPDKEDEDEAQAQARFRARRSHLEGTHKPKEETPGKKKRTYERD